MIVAQQLEFAYPRQKPVFSNLNLSVARAAIVAIGGASGIGKSTLLRLLAGLERPTAGSITLGGVIVAGPASFVAPERRSIGFVFQDHALFPHLSVADNIAFGKGAKPRARDLMHRLRLDALATHYPHELSGGQRQRVALARALAPCPEVMLLDEPFASLDPELRQHVRDETIAVIRESGATAILVTHDAMDLANVDRALTLKELLA